jgi:hypothetical protein
MVPQFAQAFNKRHETVLLVAFSAVAARRITFHLKELSLLSLASNLDTIITYSNDVFIATSRDSDAMVADIDGLRQRVLTKCAFFTEAQLWPLEVDLDAEAWLGNFLPSEQEYALRLLDNFHYFSSSLTKQLFKTAFQRLRNHVCTEHAGCHGADRRWEEFKRSLLVTHVTGEIPSDSDSGYVFARMARQELGFGIDHLVTHEEALRRLRDDFNAHVLFVDDFVGSGTQFIGTWTRRYHIPNEISYQSVLRGSSDRAFYCPVICSDVGRRALSETCSEVTVSPAHYLDRRYSIFDDNSFVWPANVRSDAIEIVRSASERAQVPGSWRGFHGLGLLLAFEHCVPDATIPLIYHDSTTPRWRPLIRRK